MKLQCVDVQHPIAEVDERLTRLSYGKYATFGVAGGVEPLAQRAAVRRREVVPEHTRTDGSQRALGDDVHALADIHRNDPGRGCSNGSRAFEDRSTEVCDRQPAAVAHPDRAIGHTARAGLVGRRATLTERLHHGVDRFRPRGFLFFPLLLFLISTEPRGRTLLGWLVVRGVGELSEDPGALLVGVEDTEIIVNAL
ncbi:Uncharacterised protein [Mycobacteroides abscessus subsp. abscessus]|nr:Uncharacterised protein [Mycobacteroides abscessus subsp. abscessus]